MASEVEMDADAIQAQIDLSMSIAHDTVTSWMKPSSRVASKANQAKDAFLEAQRELEQYMHRPARLGVGAPVPLASGSTISTKETARLKGRLVASNKKKRSREEYTGQTTASGPVPPADKEDEEDSRAGSHKKKRKAEARLSVFEGKGKKKKTNKPTDESAAQPPLGPRIPPTTPISNPAPDPPLPAPTPSETQASPQSVAPHSVLPSDPTTPIPGSAHKKKKKKKNKEPIPPSPATVLNLQPIVSNNQGSNKGLSQAPEGSQLDAEGGGLIEDGKKKRKRKKRKNKPDGAGGTGGGIAGDG